MTKYDPMTAYSEEVIGYSVNTDVHPTAYSEDDSSTPLSLMAILYVFSKHTECSTLVDLGMTVVC